MRKSQVHNITVMKTERRNLRDRQTPAEKVLWEALRNRKFYGKKFRRQHSIDCFIVDFYCSEEKMVVELDGKIHLKPDIREYDEERTEHLSALGLEVFRFRNEEILENLSEVLEKIKMNFTSPPTPLLKTGEGLFSPCF